MKIGRNDPCPCGSGIKYKKCCLDRDGQKSIPKKQVMTITRKDFISEPYKQCPDLKCQAENSFGVSFLMSGQGSYTRECIKCGYKKDYILPKIKKNILYLDQFVISNLVKLLDKSHPSHERIKADPFWESLFIKLEAASKSQAIVCPDSFYHVDESLIGNIDFRLMKRLYEHFSNGKTLYPSVIIERDQITKHFEGWLEGRKIKFELKPENIAFEKDLHSWSAGMMISVGGRPYPGQLENIQKVNTFTKEQLKEVWTRWQNEKNITFVQRVKEETLGMGKGLIEVVKKFIERRSLAMTKIVREENYNFDLDDLLPPPANDTIEDLVKIAKQKGLSEEQTQETIAQYFIDVNALLEIPQIRINAVMFAGLAHRARNGKKNPPKSTTDVSFIASYLPYCDALFLDKESALLLREFPENTPSYLRLNEFPAKIFSLNNKQAFLDYLDQLVVEIPQDQIDVLKDMRGGNYAEPYWSIIEQEKKLVNER
ncbi:MAG: SEC-C metal-binding domain-containing protein [Candidatus Komeilibacteria bacterium]|nr:SEC-C metal-binding domain-containing protein [Candidatus Komeilibacteria bacterium]